MMPEDVVISLRVPEWMASAIRAIAKAERRTVGNLIRLIIEKYLSASKGGTR